MYLHYTILILFLTFCQVFGEAFRIMSFGNTEKNMHNPLIFVLYIFYDYPRVVLYGKNYTERRSRYNKIGLQTVFFFLINNRFFRRKNNTFFYKVKFRHRGLLHNVQISIITPFVSFDHLLVTTTRRRSTARRYCRQSRIGSARGTDKTIISIFFSPSYFHSSLSYYYYY